MSALTYPLSAAEALQEVRAMINEPTAVFCTDEEINNWVIQGASDVALKGLGVIKQDSVTLVASTLTYTALTSAVSVTKICRVLGAAYDTTYKGLLRISPVALQHLPNKTSGAPSYYFHLNSVFGVYPLPTAGEAGDLVTIWYSETADAITDLPDYYQHFAIWFAASMAFAKAGKGAQAHFWMTMYLNSIAAARNDLYDPIPDTKDKLVLADRSA